MTSARLGDVSVIILTFNEEKNLPFALESIKDWAGNVFVLDSLSTDNTVRIAEASGATVMVRKFDSYSCQRNYALANFSIKTPWTMFLDADEWLTDALKTEITATLASQPPEAGFLIKRRVYWMGRWIRRGYYPTWLLRLFRTGTARCEERGVNEHLTVKGPVGRLRNDFVDENRNGLTAWIEKQNRYATLEARELIVELNGGRSEMASLFAGPAERKRWVKHRIWNKLPLGVRPFVYFTYRYLLQGGFLDGKEALFFHALQGLWLQVLIDAKFVEISQAEKVVTMGEDEPAIDTVQKR